MPKIADSKKGNKAQPILNYPAGYYSEDHPLLKGNPHLKINGNLLLIHDDVCRGSMQLHICFWRPWEDVKCSTCLKPFMIAVYIVPTEPFDDHWNFTREIFAGGYPQCFCNSKLKHYKYLNKIIEDEPADQPEKTAKNPFEDRVPF